MHDKNHKRASAAVGASIESGAGEVSVGAWKSSGTSSEKNGPEKDGVDCTCIRNGMRVHGLLEGNGSVRIAGELLGSIKVEGTIWVEAGARVSGDVHGSSVRLEGIVMGNVRAAAEVTLANSCKVYGDVCAVRIQVNPEATVHGKVEELGSFDRASYGPPSHLTAEEAPLGRVAADAQPSTSPTRTRSLRMRLPHRARGTLRKGGV